MSDAPSKKTSEDPYDIDPLDDLRARLDQMDGRIDALGDSISERFELRFAPLEKLAAWAEELRRENMSKVELDEEDMHQRAVDAGFTPEQIAFLDRLNHQGNENATNIGNEIDDILGKLRRPRDERNWTDTILQVAPLVQNVVGVLMEKAKDSTRPWWQKKLRKLLDV